jgi:hypothetical protein
MLRDRAACPNFRQVAFTKKPMAAEFSRGLRDRWIVNQGSFAALLRPEA